jgi:hypothetical protein
MRDGAIVELAARLTGMVDVADNVSHAERAQLFTWAAVDAGQAGGAWTAIVLTAHVLQDRAALAILGSTSPRPGRRSRVAGLRWAEPFATAGRAAVLCLS